MFKLKLFALSFLLATGTFLVIIYANYRKQINSAAPTLVQVADNVFITSQLTPDGVYSLKDHGIVTVVDIRPDGEEPGQTSSAGIKFRSMQLGLRFHYIPVPHESIPDGAVSELSEVLSHKDATPALLYCHSGRRAARTFALTEASRAGGPGTDAILDMVRDAGFAADDLRDNITQRISQRKSVQPETK